MDTLSKILLALLLGFVVFSLYRRLKQNPQLLEKSSISKSFTTMGLLGIILIVFFALLVMLLNSGHEHVTDNDSPTPFKNQGYSQGL